MEMICGMKVGDVNDFEQVFQVIALNTKLKWGTDNLLYRWSIATDLIRHYLPGVWRALLYDEQMDNRGDIKINKC